GRNSNAADSFTKMMGGTMPAAPGSTVGLYSYEAKLTPKAANTTAHYLMAAHVEMNPGFYQKYKAFNVHKSRSDEDRRTAKQLVALSLISTASALITAAMCAMGVHPDPEESYDTPFYYESCLDGVAVGLEGNLQLNGIISDQFLSK